LIAEGQNYSKPKNHYLHCSNDASGRTMMAKFGGHKRRELEGSNEPQPGGQAQGECVWSGELASLAEPWKKLANDRHGMKNARFGLFGWRKSVG
jgi:hypothetical protein